MRHPDMERSGGPSVGHPDEGTIHAWLDGALSESEGAALEAHLAHCVGCREMVAEARGLVAASSRVLRALDFGPGGVGERPMERPIERPSGRGSREDDGADAADTSSPEEQLPEPPALPVEPLPDDVRPIRGARSANARRVRRWRVPAIAAVAVMAIGTTVVLRERGGGAPVAESALRSPSADARAADGSAPPLAAAPAVPGAPGEAGGSAASAGVGAATAAEAARGAPPAAPPSPSALAAGDATVGAAAKEQFGASNITAAQATEPARRQAGNLPAAVVGPVIAGRVLTRAGGQPVADAVVDLADLARSVTTDSLGRFRLSGVPTGEHRATVRGAGLEPQQLALQVVPSGDSAVVVAMAPRQQAETADRRVAAAAGAPAAPLPAPAPAPAAKVAGEARSPVVTSAAPAAPAVPQPPTPPAAIQRLVGCYRVELSGTASPGLELAERTLPGWVELRSGAAARNGGWLAIAAPASSRPAPRAGWRLSSDREVEVVWPAADGEEVLLHLSGSGEALVGTASLARPGGGGEVEVASVVAVRSVCTGPGGK